jgi:hypothetical protein
MKKKTRNIIIIILILAILFSVYYFNFYKGQIVKYTLVDFCFSYYPQNEGKYPYIQGKLNIPTQTFNIGGKIVSTQVIYKMFNPQMWCSGSGMGGDLRVFYKLCNSKGDCVERDDYLRPWTYQNDYSDCYNNCNKYNYVGQCGSEYRAKLPISYTCTNICLYQGDFYIDYFNQIPGDYSYTLTITKVRKYVCSDCYHCSWVDGSISDLTSTTEMYYLIFYNPNESPIVLPPPKPQPIWEVIINKILDWLKSLFSFFKFEIYGEAYPTVGSQQSYIINITTTKPDKDYNDGSYQVQYASWALVDGSGNIINKGEWEEVDGSYYKQITLTIPPNPGNYVLVGVIYQYDMKYNSTTLKWNIINEGVVAKEALNLNAKIIQPPTPPTPNLFAILKNIWCWLLGLFGLRC